jgi:hypothetical protein
MAYRIIKEYLIIIQYIILDFIRGLTWETIDCRTQEGKKRYRELFGSLPNKRIGRSPSANSFSSHSRDIQFLSNNYNEQDRRLFAGFLVSILGQGGTKEVAHLTNVDMKTVRKGKKELINRTYFQNDRIRCLGGGRATKVQANPRYEKELQAIVEDEIAGDPMNERKWTRKTLRWIKKELQARGIKASLSTIRNSLKYFNISLKKNVKDKNIQNHPNRNEQFLYLNRLKHEFLTSGKPIISIDTKKKEFIGNFKNDGKIWRKEPYKVLDHDYPSLAEGKLIPFGIYDLKQNKGYVYCGTSVETSEFVVDCLILWWTEVGKYQYPYAYELLILCDSGGANGYRRRAWKWELQTKLADTLGLTVIVCHYPSGASKYNPIEHKLFSFISINWAGEPLTSYNKALGLISSTKTEKGLKVDARIVDKDYKTGVKISDEHMKSLKIEYKGACPQWNYIIKPR